MIAMRPRILLIGDSLNVGGTEGQFVEVACGLDRSRWDVHLTCNRAVGPLRARIEAAGMRVWSCGPGSFKSPRFALALGGLARYLRTHRIRLVHSFDFYSNILGVIAARLAQVPMVIASQRELGDLRPPLPRRVNAIALRLANYVLINSPAVAEWVSRQRAIAPSRIVLIPNGVDLTRFSTKPRSAEAASEPVTIGTLANLRPEKGLAEFIRASALVGERWPQARFLIWGDGPLRRELQDLVSQLGLGTAVHFQGATVEPEVALHQLDIFVLPSLSEACSNVLLEAMATGLPVVTTSVGGNPALVEEGTTGLLVPPGDAAALAKAIIRLLEDPALAWRLGVNARNVVRSNYGLERMLSRVQALYERALGAS